MDISDVDDIVTTSNLNAGTSDGSTTGYTVALQTGRNYGIMKGYEVGVEMGYYDAVCRVVLGDLERWVGKGGRRERVEKGCRRVITDVEGVGGEGKEEVEKSARRRDASDGDEGGDSEGGGLMDVVMGTRARFKVISRACKMGDEWDIKKVLGGKGGGEEDEGIEGLDDGAEKTVKGKMELLKNVNTDNGDIF